MKKFSVLYAMLLAVITMTGCDNDDPKPVVEEELITTLWVFLEPAEGGEQVTLRFYDEDGESGSIPPVVTVEGKLKADQEYNGLIQLLNETVDPAEDITEEIYTEGDAHLFCFDVDGAINIVANDQDSNGLPIGLATTWTTGAAGEASVRIILRHQYGGTKTGECPGGGETDIEVTFDVVVE